MLKHTLVIQRATTSMPDRYGHTEPTWPDAETVRGLVQSLKDIEVNGPALGGQVIGDVRIYLEPVELDEQDQIKDITAGHHDALYLVNSVIDAGGQGTHLEVLATNIDSGEAPS